MAHRLAPPRKLVRFVRRHLDIVFWNLNKTAGDSPLLRGGYFEFLVRPLREQRLIVAEVLRNLAFRQFRRNCRHNSCVHGGCGSLGALPAAQSSRSEPPAAECCIFSTVEFAHHWLPAMVEWPIFCHARDGTGSTELRRPARRRCVNGCSSLVWRHDHDEDVAFRGDICAHVFERRLLLLQLVETTGSAAAGCGLSCAGLSGARACLQSVYDGAGDVLAAGGACRACRPRPLRAASAVVMSARRWSAVRIAAFVRCARVLRASPKNSLFLGESG